jgi:hypothetical protein
MREICKFSMTRGRGLPSLLSRPKKTAPQGMQKIFRYSPIRAAPDSRRRRVPCVSWAKNSAPRQDEKDIQPQTHTDEHRQKNLGLCLNVPRRCQGKPGTRSPQASNLLPVRLQQAIGGQLYPQSFGSPNARPGSIKSVCVRLCVSVAKK